MMSNMNNMCLLCHNYDFNSVSFNLYFIYFYLYKISKKDGK